MADISVKAGQVKKSSTLALTSLAKGMIKEGRDVVLFGAGEPDFEPPREFDDSFYSALKEGKTKYTPVAGIAELRKAIADYSSEKRGTNLVRENVIVTPGAKYSLFLSMMAVLNRGDEIIIPRPYWVSYAEQAKLADAAPVIADSGEDFEIRADLIESKLTQRTRAILVNSPNNPSGQVLKRQEARKIADMAIENDIWIISDEVYEPFVYEGKHSSFLSLGDDVKSRTIVINGFSKSLAITGLRIGYAIAPENVIDAMSGMQGHTVSNVCSALQYAALDVLNKSLLDSFSAGMRRVFNKRRMMMYSSLKKIEGVNVYLPMGAFYMFPDVSSFYSEKINGSFELSELLLNKAGVAVIPGAGFGADNNIRLSYACSDETIEKGMERLAEFFSG